MRTRKVIHLARPVFMERHASFTSGSVSTALYMIGGEAVEVLERDPETEVVYWDLRPRTADEIIGWQPVCGAPMRPRRARQDRDWVSCKNCLRTHAYREWVDSDRREPNERERQVAA